MLGRMPAFKWIDQGLGPKLFGLTFSFSFSILYHDIPFLSD